MNTQKDFDDSYELLADNIIIINNDDFFFDLPDAHKLKQKIYNHIGKTVGHLKQWNKGIIIYKKVNNPLFECERGFPWGY